MPQQTYHLAPKGFTPQQWEQFVTEGLLVIENALSKDEIDHYLEAIDRCCASDGKYDPAKFYMADNIVERDPVFAELIDHSRHVGYVYDIYGEQLKLHLSQFFIRRPRDKSQHHWHHDGARVVPYAVFAPELSLQVKISYWLTDLPSSRMGNFVYLPGSHRSQYSQHYHTHESAPDEKVLCVPKGAMTLVQCNTWHRVEPNESDAVRKNIFLAYCPSWICEGDRYQSSPQWLKTLNREQRIIMRSYSHGYHRAKPPAEDFPLFLDRETGCDSDPDADTRVPLHQRKRQTMHEKLRSTATNQANPPDLQRNLKA